MQMRRAAGSQIEKEAGQAHRDQVSRRIRMPGECRFAAAATAAAAAASEAATSNAAATLSAPRQPDNTWRGAN